MKTYNAGVLRWGQTRRRRSSADNPGCCGWRLPCCIQSFCGIVHSALWCTKLVIRRQFVLVWTTLSPRTVAPRKRRTQLLRPIALIVNLLPRRLAQQLLPRSTSWTTG